LKPAWLALGLVVLVQAACSVVDVLPDVFCEMQGGKWHERTEYSDAWCEEKKPSAPSKTPAASPPETPNNPSRDMPTTSSPSSSPLELPTGEYLTPTPGSTQGCDATLYIQSGLEVVKNVQEAHYRDCDYKLSLTNVHPSAGIWVVWRKNTSVHSSATNLDDRYWYSDLLAPDQLWEKTFRSSYFTDGQTSREAVDRVAGVYNRPECLYLLTSAEVEAISQPVEEACGP
jgi:hypothetical protein